MKNICSVEGCDKIKSVRGYCHNHYALFLRNGYPGYKKMRVNCKMEGCNERTRSLGYCHFHYHRFKHNVPLDIIGHAGKGVRNGRWKGGISEYSNHSEMKKTRLLKLQQVDYICENCSKKAYLIHHIDKTKSNHDLDNLKALCRSCHYKNHPKKTSKFKRLYGFTLTELSNKLNIPIHKVYLLHIAKKLSI